MLYYIGKTYMSRGKSGRIVLEVDISLKESLYISLARKNLTLKDWFIKESQAFIDKVENPLLFTANVAEKEPSYNKDK